MSWRERRRKEVSTAAAGTLALLLGGCFHPLYGPIGETGNKTVIGEMQAVAVDPIPERLGHYLGDDLLFALNGTGDSVPARYRLAVTPKENVTSAIVDTLQQRATAATLTVSAPFQLLDNNRKVLFAGSVIESADYDRSDQRFANVRAARDAEIRVAQVLADEIRTRVAAYFATHP